MDGAATLMIEYIALTQDPTAMVADGLLAALVTAVLLALFNTDGDK